MDFDGYGGRPMFFSVHGSWLSLMISIAFFRRKSTSFCFILLCAFQLYTLMVVSSHPCLDGM